MSGKINKIKNTLLRSQVRRRTYRASEVKFKTLIDLCPGSIVGLRAERQEQQAEEQARLCEADAVLTTVCRAYRRQPIKRCLEQEGTGLLNNRTIS